ncbi:MAG: triple tyrosine motif-containing protein, partial [Cyclobacteriaceae bacterium]
YEFDHNIYVLDSEGNSYQVEGRKLSQTTEKIASKDLLFVGRQDNSETYLAADTDNTVFLYRDGFSEILTDILDTKDRRYLLESEVTSGVWVNDSLVAISTLKGGVVFIDPHAQGARKVQNIVNYQNDLPDNEVFDMELDNSKALWVVHEKGFTRIATEYPFRRYDHFPGLEGKLLNAYTHDGVLYVGSSQGLYFLKETPVYEKKKERYTAWVTEDAKSDRKGFLNRLFSKKKVTRKPKEIVRTTKKFHSIQHEFQKLEPVSSKVFHLASIKGDLFAGGLDGLFKVEDGRVEQLTNVPVKYFHYSEWRNRIYAITYDGHVIELEPGKMNQNGRDIFTDVTEPVHYIFEGTRGELFLTGIHTLYVIPMASGQMNRIPFENPFYEETFGVIEDDSVYLVNESGVYRVSKSEGHTYRIAGVENPERILRGSDDQVWILGSAGWKAPGKHIDETKFRHLLTLDGILFVAETGDQHGLWVITENDAEDNALFYLLPQESSEWFEPNKLFVQEINTSGGKRSPYGRISLKQEESFVSFDFRQPDYSGIMNTEYRYDLTGEMDEVSSWDVNNHTVKFTYLPAGEYHLRVQARNALGQVSEISDVSFKVLAPYWKRTWFNVAYFHENEGNGLQVQACKPVACAANAYYNH